MECLVLNGTSRWQPLPPWLKDHNGREGRNSVRAEAVDDYMEKMFSGPNRGTSHSQCLWQQAQGPSKLKSDYVTEGKGEECSSPLLAEECWQLRAAERGGVRLLLNCTLGSRPCYSQCPHICDYMGSTDWTWWVGRERGVGLKGVGMGSKYNQTWHKIFNEPTKLKNK